MNDYWLETRKSDGTFICKIPYWNLQYEIGFNGTTGIRWSTPLYHELVSQETIAPGLHEVWVVRNGKTVAAGPLWDVSVSTDTKSLTCGAQSLEDYFDVRLLQDVTYDTLDQTAIAWDMINTSQGRSGGALGITQGTLNTGITRSSTFTTYDEKRILEAIQDMSELEDGFDFWIDPDTRKFQARYPRPSVNRGLHLVYPANIASYALNMQGKYVRSRVVVQGPEPEYSVSTNTTVEAKYGLREYGDALKDAGTSDELTEYTTHVGNLRSEISSYPTLVLRDQTIDVFDTNTIQYGDMVRVTIKDGYIDIDAMYRYKGAQLTVNKSGDEIIVLYMQDDREVT